MKEGNKILLICVLLIGLMGAMCFLLIPERMEHSAGQKTQETQPPVPDLTEAAEELQRLQREKQYIETQLETLQNARSQEEKLPLNLMILFSTLEEPMIREASAMMDEKGIPGILGISFGTLQAWGESDIPTYIQERLEKGWDLCYILEDKPMDEMKRMAQTLMLPEIIAGYAPDGDEAWEAGTLLDSGVYLLMADGIEYCSQDQGLWYIPAVGSMASAGYSFYDSMRGSGETIVYVAGYLKKEHEYLDINFEGMIEVFTEDPTEASIQSLRRQYESGYFSEGQNTIRHKMIAYDQQHKELQEQWNEIMRRIGNLRQKMDSMKTE